MRRAAGIFLRVQLLDLARRGGPRAPPSDRSVMLDAFRITIENSLRPLRSRERGAAAMQAARRRCPTRARRARRGRRCCWRRAPSPPCSRRTRTRRSAVSRPPGGPPGMAYRRRRGGAAAPPTTAGGRPPTKTPAVDRRGRVDLRLAGGAAAGRRRPAVAGADVRGAAARAVDAGARPGSAGINDTFPADLLDAFKPPPRCRRSSSASSRRPPTTLPSAPGSRASFGLYDARET